MLPADSFGPPMAVQIGLSVGVVLLVLALMRWSYWWLFGSKVKGYRPRRAYRWWKPGQRRPAPRELRAELEDDFVRVLPPTAALPAADGRGAVDVTPVPYRYRSRAHQVEEVA